MNAGTTSVVLPVHNQAEHIEQIVSEYASALGRSGISWEIILVPNACSDGSDELCIRLAAADDRIRTVPSAPGGWGRAVRLGLAAARGDVLCYTNSARTTPTNATQENSSRMPRSVKNDGWKKFDRIISR